MDPIAVYTMRPVKIQIKPIRTSYTPSLTPINYVLLNFCCKTLHKTFINLVCLVTVIRVACLHRHVLPVLPTVRTERFMILRCGILLHKEYSNPTY